MYEINKRTIGNRLADADLSTKQFYLVKETATGVALAGDGENVMGALDNAPGLSEPAAVAIGDVVQVLAGGVIAKGGEVICSALGKALPAAGAAVGKIKIGVAQEASAADGNIIPVRFAYRGVT